MQHLSAHALLATALLLLAPACGSSADDTTPPDMAQDQHSAPDLSALDMTPDVGDPADMAQAADMDMSSDMPAQSCPTPSAEPAPLPSAPQVAVGEGVSCALNTAGSIYCWGAGALGQRGDGRAGDIAFAVGAVQGIEGHATSLAMGSKHACAISDRGALYCWGHNVFGQLGSGTPNSNPFMNNTIRDVPSSLVAVRVEGIPCEVEQVAAGEHHTCALTRGGDVYCWGRNHDGQLGNGEETLVLAQGSARPSKVIGIDADATSIAAGERHTCATTRDGAVKCWGSNALRELGDRDARAFTAGEVRGAQHAIAVAAGQESTCAILAPPDAPRALFCWGTTYGVAHYTGTPTQRPDISDPKQIAIGDGFACVLHEAGDVSCWGSNSMNQLGVYNYKGDRDGRQLLSSPTAQHVGLLPDQVFTSLDIDANGSHTCGVTTAGEVLCWGANGSGELGRRSMDAQGSERPLLAVIPAD
jgi:alpha-tubulin suppressor-like RCC1 family protein